jgi:hypothetical protein
VNRVNRNKNCLRVDGGIKKFFEWGGRCNMG